MLEPRLRGAIVHRTAGRARLRFAGLRGAEAQLNALAARLGALPGVTGVAANPLTGSVVLRHRLAWPAIADAAAGACAIAWDETAEGVDPARLPGGTVDLRLLLGVAFALLALWQLARNHVLPPALTLLWYAATLAGDRSPET